MILMEIIIKCRQKNIVHGFYILSIRMYINGLKKKKFQFTFITRKIL